MPTNGEKKPTGAKKGGKPTTSKKVKLVGTQQYVNASTGELVDMQVTSVEERDFNFAKVWMRSFLATLDLVGNAKTKVAFWVIENINRENQLTYTYRQIAEATGKSLDTVNDTMKVLLESNFLRRRNQGCYIVNPDIVFKGTRNARLNVLTQYGELEREKPQPPTPEEKLQNLMTTIKKLTDEAQKLSDEIKNKKVEEPLPGQMEMELEEPDFEAELQADEQECTNFDGFAS